MCYSPSHFCYCELLRLGSHGEIIVLSQNYYAFITVESGFRQKMESLPTANYCDLLIIGR